MRLACRPELAALCLTEGRKGEANSRAQRAAECRSVCAMAGTAPHPRLSSSGLTGRSSIPEVLVIERTTRGVLDAPLARSMTAVDGAQAAAFVIPGWSEGPNLRSAIAHRGISRFSDVQLHIAVRCRACHRAAPCAAPVASPPNDGLKWIASLALAKTSWPSFETYRCPRRSAG